jgi:hypothetical protein
MDIKLTTDIPKDFEKQIQEKLVTMLPPIIDARVNEILKKDGYSK